MSPRTEHLTVHASPAARATRPARAASVATVAVDADALAEVLPRLARSLRRPVVRPGSRRPLGRLHAQALAALLGSPQGVGALARSLGRSTPTVSIVVSDLADAGLVVRRNHPRDRRRTIVTVAEEHRAVVEAWVFEARAPLERALGRLTASERAAFVRGVHLLEEELASAV